jgi:hypothetical protein
MATENKTSSGNEKKNKDAVLVAATVLVLALIGYLVYNSHSQRVAGVEAGQGPATKVVANPRLESDTPQARELKQAALEGAEKWREEMLAKPEEERMLPDGRVLVPEIVVYEDNDIYMPMRRMVPAETEPATDNAGMPLSAEEKPAPKPGE